MKIFLNFIFFLIALTISVNLNASARIQLSAKEIKLNDTVTLKIIIDHYQKLTLPDLTTLQKDFKILNQGQSERISIINGNTEKEFILTYTLLPKKIGLLTIPSFEINTNSTQAQTIKVEEASTQNIDNHSKPSIFIETDLSPDEPFVQSQIKYRLKLFYSENISNGALSDPIAPDSVLINLNQDKQSQAYRHGQLYQVLERNYVIFPEKSGTLKIKGSEFSGLRNQDSFDDFFGVHDEPIKLVGKTKTVTVKPVPNHIPAREWLPAKQVELTEQWTMPPIFETGYPIVRSVHLKVYGATQAQLPELKQAALQNVKLYSGETKTNQYSLNGDLISEKTQKFTYIPTQSGAITLSPLSVRWWNLVENRLETTETQSKTLSIATKTNPIAASETTPVKATVLNENNQAHSTKTLQSDYAFALFFFLLWVLTILLWLSQKKIFHLKIDSEKKHFKKLLQACLKNDPKKTEYCLIRWAKAYWSQQQPRNLHDIANLLGTVDLKTEILRLQSACYGTETNWEGKALYSALKAYKKRADTQAKETGPQLMKLYPE